MICGVPKMAWSKGKRNLKLQEKAKNKEPTKVRGITLNTLNIVVDGNLPGKYLSGTFRA